MNRNLSISRQPKRAKALQHFRTAVPASRARVAGLEELAHRIHSSTAFTFDSAQKTVAEALEKAKVS